MAAMHESDVPLRTQSREIGPLLYCVIPFVMHERLVQVSSSFSILSDIIAGAAATLCARPRIAMALRGRYALLHAF